MISSKYSYKTKRYNKLKLIRHIQDICENLNSEHTDAVTQRCQDIIQTNPYYLPDILNTLYHQGNSNPPGPIYQVLFDLYYLTNQLDDAFDCCEELYEINPEYNALYINISKIAAKDYNPEHIKSFLETAFSERIYDPALVDVLSQLYVKSNELEKGIKLYETLIQYRPHFIPYHKTLYEFYKNTHQYTKAMHCISTIAHAENTLMSDCVRMAEELINLSDHPLDLKEDLIPLYIQNFQPDDATKIIDELVQSNHLQPHNAIDYFQKVLTIYPRHKNAQLRLAHLYIQQSHYTEGVQLIEILTKEADSEDIKNYCTILENVLTLMPSHHLALELLTTLYPKIGDTLKTIQTHAQLAVIESENTEYHIQKITALGQENLDLTYEAQLTIATITFQTHQPSKCIAICHRLLDSPRAKDAYILMSQAEEIIGNKTRAKQVLLEALQHVPFDAGIHAQLKTLTDDIITESIHHRITALTAPNMQDYFEIGLMFLRQADPQKALEQFQQVREPMDLQEKAQILCSRCFLEMGRYDLAYSQLKRVLKSLTFTDIRTANKLRYLCAINALLSGRITKAVSLLENVAEFDSSFPNIQNTITQYNYYPQDPKTPKMMTASLLMPHNPPHFFVIPDPQLQTLPKESEAQLNANASAIEMIVKHQWKAAKTMLKKSISETPSAILLNTLSMILLHQQDFEKARTALTQAQSFDQQFPELEMNIGATYLMQNQYETALRHFKKAQDENVQSIALHLHLGDTYYGLGDIQKANDEWEIVKNRGIINHLIARRTYHLNAHAFTYSHWLNDLIPTSSDTPIPNETLSLF